MTNQSQNRNVAVFNQLCALTGNWKRNDTAKNEFVEFRMTAGNTVLVENWTWPDRNIEAMTLYHFNGNQLMATHYCPIGNQPRLIFQPTDDKLKYVFRFNSATNLTAQTADHCIEFWIKINDIGSFTRSETYTDKGGLDTQEARYVKLR